MLFKLLVRLSCYIGFSSAFLSCTTKSSNSLLLRKALSFVAANKLPCSFHDFNIPEWLVKRCEELGYLHPTLPQQLSLPSILEGKDVVLQAQTGSGKTLTFVLPVLTSITPSRSAIQAVVVVPTRELGQQVVSTFKLLAHGSPEKIMIMSVLEGSMNRRQQLWATAEPPHIVVGNPKALQKLVDIGRLRLNSVNMVVIDEVDACLINADTRQELHTLLSRRLSNSFQNLDDILIDEIRQNTINSDKIYDALFKYNRDDITSQSESDYRNHRQTILCSATIPQRQHFIQTCYQKGWTLTLPELIHVTPTELVPKQVKHEYIVCEYSKRFACLRYLIQKEYQNWMKMKAKEQSVDDTTEVSDFRVIVFIDTHDEAESLVDILSVEFMKMISMTQNDDEVDDDAPTKRRRSSLKDHLKLKKNNEEIKTSVVSYLNADTSLDKRSDTLQSFRNGECRVLISSELAARGIDVPDTSHIFHISLPKTVEAYLHRSGRTGRLGRKGKVITLIEDEQKFVIQRFSNELGIDIKERKLAIRSK